MKYIILVCCLSASVLFAQDRKLITLDNCQQAAQIHYPLLKQSELIQLESQYKEANTANNYRPQFQFNAQATYQSDVTSLPIKMPGVEGMDKDQYKFNIDAQQLIWDGGQTHSQQQINQQQAILQQNELQVQLYPLRDRVNSLYFGYLIAQSQYLSAQIYRKDLQTSQETVEALRANGMANEGDVEVVRAAIIEVEQQQDALQSSMKMCIDRLNLLTKMEISEADSLVLPNYPQPRSMSTPVNNRPELQLFAAQKQLFDEERGLINAKNRPRLSLFAQAGYAKPGLNMLANQFAWFGLGGVRLSWNLGNLYNRKRDLQLIHVRQQSVDVQQELFELQSQLQLQKHKNDIAYYAKALDKDRQLMESRTAIRKVAESKYKNGVYTINDLIKDINAENRALQTHQLHAIQLQLSCANYQVEVND